MRVWVDSLMASVLIAWARFYGYFLFMAVAADFSIHYGSVEVLFQVSSLRAKQY